MAAKNRPPPVLDGVRHRVPSKKALESLERGEQQQQKVRVPEGREVERTKGGERGGVKERRKEIPALLFLSLLLLPLPPHPLSPRGVSHKLK